MGQPLHLNKHWVWLVVLAFVLVVARPGGANAEPEDVLPLFQSEEVLKITIEAPFGTLVKTSGKPRDFAGRVLFHSGLEEISLDIQLRARGKSRRNKAICTFPPLSVNFKKGQVKGTLFKGQNKLKLVTHCKKSSRYEQLYFLEYANYQAYNLLTPISLKVRMAEITFVDSEGKMKTITRHGFFIEDIDDLAERNSLKELGVAKLKNTNLNTYQGALYALFQYFIGNLDWSNIEGIVGEDCCHNTKLLTAPDGYAGRGAVYPVPYDFDFSGMVNAPYATAPEEVRITNIRTRVYRGACLFNRDIPKVTALFKSLRADLEKTYGAGLLLNQRNKTSALTYIEGFYTVINDPKKLEKKIIRSCLGRRN